MKFISGLFCSLFFLVVTLFGQQESVFISFQGELGNQLFQMATALSLAHDSNAIACITGSITHPRISEYKENIEKFFVHIPYSSSAKKSINFLEKRSFAPIPYTAGMGLRGYFENYRYFHHNRNIILDKFAPSQEIVEYLQKNFSHIINHENSVAVHVRTYYRDLVRINRRLGTNTPPSVFFPQSKLPPPDLSFYEKAIASFSKDALFVVFSDCPEWCKKVFSSYDRHFIFIETGKAYHDIHLMSLCKHQILANSTFGFWGAYLNQNPNKRVIVRTPWWNDSQRTENIVLPEWERLEGNQNVPLPDFGNLPID